MEESNKIIQGLGIPHSALLSIIFGMMVVSFPLGIYVVFDTNVGNDINFEFPLSSLNFFVAGLGVELPTNFELGDVFIVLWSIYAILFTIAFLGPKSGFLKTLIPILSHGKLNPSDNYMVSITKWFSILILISGIINFIQEGFGIVITPPAAENNLIQFYQITLAPLIEEIGFRVLLIGLPLFVLYSHKNTVSNFFKSLWHPSRYLDVYDNRKVIALIIAVGIFFGLAHVLSGEPWSNGKFTQATISGIILGWVYYRFGLLPAILVHWGTNYFIYAYVNFISQLNFVSVSEAFSHSLLNTMEIIFVVSGILSTAILIISYLNSKKEKHLEI